MDASAHPTDRFEVINFLHGWMLLADTSDVEAMAEAFVEDATYDVKGFTVEGVPSSMRGRDEISSGFDSRFRAAPRIGSLVDRQSGTRGSRRRHHLTSLVIDQLQEDLAEVRSYVLVTRATEESIEIAVSGLFEDEVVRCSDGKWRFKRRVFTPDAPVTA